MKIITYIKKLLPKTTIESGEAFFWSPKHDKITYKASTIDQPIGQWSILHETAHSLLGHLEYSSDLELLQLEVDAWDKAKDLARDIDIKIDENHIQDCLDTYRDWLHRRSTCPKCSVVCIQVTTTLYKCHNCYTSWNVSASRFCRPYRLQTGHKQQEKPKSLTPTFS
ncbi:MAG TPA: hypothetical protein VMR76_00730 [Candidatus Saccharimonadia bacterium]|nr:hypothetical protein [Candidatus Saccharimonadia bacterium]